MQLRANVLAGMPDDPAEARDWITAQVEAKDAELFSADLGRAVAVGDDAAIARATELTNERSILLAAAVALAREVAAAADARRAVIEANVAKAAEHRELIQERDRHTAEAQAIMVRHPAGQPAADRRTRRRDLCRVAELRQRVARIDRRCVELAAPHIPARQAALERRHVTILSARVNLVTRPYLGPDLSRWRGRPRAARARRRCTVAAALAGRDPPGEPGDDDPHGDADDPVGGCCSSGLPGWSSCAKVWPRSRRR